jgi:glycosyltransferase involved in cell wall biosynthesis
LPGAAEAPTYAGHVGAKTSLDPPPSTASVAVLAVHPAQVAATRLRAAQYAEPLTAYGIDLKVWSFLREEDLADWFGHSQFRRATTVLKALLRLPRLLEVIRGCRAVVVQREALPLGPPVVEWLASRRRRLIWDVDDAVWESFESPTAGRVPQWIRATGRKYHRICRRADEVWAGSEVLAAWCRTLNAETFVIPTVVDVPNKEPSPRAERVVGWIGSHSTTPFVEAVLPAISKIEPAPEVVVVGGRPQPPPNVNLRVLEWSPAIETETLDRTRVGLYPIDRSHPLADGKCGLKAILYMAHGVPCVVTPTMTNAAIVRSEVDGLYAETLTEWTAAVERLLDDDALWRKMSDAAYRRARDEYSLQIWAPRMATRLMALMGTD